MRPESAGFDVAVQSGHDLGDAWIKSSNSSSAGNSFSHDFSFLIVTGRNSVCNASAAHPTKPQLSVIWVKLGHLLWGKLFSGFPSDVLRLNSCVLRLQVSSVSCSWEPPRRGFTVQDRNGTPESHIMTELKTLTEEDKSRKLSLTKQLIWFVKLHVLCCETLSIMGQNNVAADQEHQTPG